MTPELGTGLGLLALFFAAIGSVLGFHAGYRHHLGAWTWSRRAAWGFATSMLGANLLMVWALLQHDFSVRYVSEVGSRDTPVYFTIVSLWASLDGSILFWGGILSVYTIGFLATMGTRHREYMPWTLGVHLAVSVFFCLLVTSVANPFERVDPIPLDGPGPNPLLQNHWLMAVHPPMLYLGYVGMVIPYAMICAALLAGRLEDGWMVPLRRWMLVPWTFLTVGIVLGGWWSYGVLGWGGAWAWDPVENASFHPWLTGTAFLHSAMVFQKRGTLRIWTLTLGIATFLLTLVGTFMTRSGVFNSVHSFTQSSIGPVFLVFIGVVFVASVILLAARDATLSIDNDAKSAPTTLMSQVMGFEIHPLSREVAILLQNGVFTVFTFMVLTGTLYPLITEATSGAKLSVGEPWFDRTAMPLGLLMVFLMGVGPALPWGRMAPERAALKLAGPAGFGLLFAGAFAYNGFDGNWTMFSLWLCGFALAANFGELLAPVRARMASRGESAVEATTNTLSRTRRRFGGHVAHYGAILAVVSITLWKGYKNEIDVTLRKGASAEIEGWTATYEGARLVQEPHRKSVIADFRVSRGGAEVGVVEPRLNYYPTQREPVYSPAILEGWGSDFYVSVVELDKDGAYVVVRLITMPGILWLWIAPGIIALGTLIVLWPDRRAAASRAVVSGSEAAA